MGQLLISKGVDINAKDEEVGATVSDEVQEKQFSSVLGNGTLTPEAKEKLDKYDALEKSVVSLSKEKQMLEDKVAEYVEKLKSNEDAVKKIEKLNAEIANLKKKLDEANSKGDSISLKNECKLLRDEADGYLVKISELTFENANLTCQLNELKKNSTSNSPHKQTSTLARPRKDPYNPYRNNGYGSW